VAGQPANAHAVPRRRDGVDQPQGPEALEIKDNNLQGKRVGTDSSLKRIVMKPTHFIGGYGQLSFAFNYYGPTGSHATR
jgi:nitrate reductase alpha subunit